MAAPLIDLTRAVLADQFNRRITYLRVSVTDKCNLRCVYCMPEQGLPWLPKSDILTYEEIVEIVRAAASAGVRSVRLSGGEPLVRKDLPRLVAALAAIEGIEDIALSTNGLLLEDQLDALAAAGLNRVNVSLDTLSEDRFYAIARRPGLNRVLAGIDAAIASGLTPVKINCVVMRGQNDDEIAAFAQWTRRRPVFVRFIELMPVHENLGVQRDAYISADEILDRVSAIGELQPSIGPGGTDRRATSRSPEPRVRWASSARSRTTIASAAIACASPPTADCVCAFSAITRSTCAGRCGPAPAGRRSPGCLTRRCSSSPSVTTCGSVRHPRGCALSAKSAGKAVTLTRRIALLGKGGQNVEQVYLIATEAQAAHARVEALVREHQGKLARYVRRMVGDADLALDIVQDVFFAAYRTLSADPSRELTPGWLYKTATNTSISFLRRKKILRFMPLDRDHDVRSLRIDERSAASLDLQAAMRRLPADQAAAIMLTSYAGYSSAEAATILGTTADAVRQRVCRAMRTLRAVMTETA